MAAKRCLLVVGLVAATPTPCPTAAPTVGTASSPTPAADSYRRNLQTTSGCYSAIAGYTPYTDVVEHSEIDLDMSSIKTYLETPDFGSARTLYTNGLNSVKSSGAVRNIKGFSKSLAGEPFYDIWNSYWGSTTYADDQVSAALDGTSVTWATPGITIDFTSVANVTRVETAQKTMAYSNVWMYVLHEYEAGIDKCQSSSYTTTEAVHAWDEGWAFYAGSLVSSSSDGKLIYELAEKRCANFVTCTGDSDNDAASGTALSNSLVLAASTAGKTYLLADDCTSADAELDTIKQQMIVPLVQGMLRYAYKSQSSLGGGDKEIAEGWAFASSILPYIASCDATVGATIVTNMKVGSTTPMADGFDTLKSQIESTYDCMGITCEDIGGMVDGTGTTPYVYSFDACTATVSAAAGTPISHGVVYSVGLLSTLALTLMAL